MTYTPMNHSSWVASPSSGSEYPAGATRETSPLTGAMIIR